MRKILYRAKSLEKDNLGEWVYGDLIHHNEETFYILPQNRELSELYTYGILIDKNTIGQFIGIHDSNRKEIYEGDIITFLIGTYIVKWSLSDLSFRMERWINEDEAVKLVNKLLEFQEGLKSYNKEFNIFGDDITDYDKDYILQHIVINKVGVSKYLEWELYNREGIFLPEWFGMNLKDVMIKDLHARRLSAELEIETLEDKIRKIDREIERYENNSY